MEEEVGTFPALLPLGLGLGLSSLLLLPPQTLKPLSSAAKLAAAAFSLRRHPSPSTFLLLTSKALVKAYKSSNHRPPSPRHLKPYLAAANLARHAILASGSLGFNRLYKISKNLVRVLEGLVGVQIDSGLRSRIGAVGLLVKAAVVVSEIERRVAGRKRFGMLRFAGLRTRVCLRCRRTEGGCGGAGVGGFWSECFGMEEMIGEEAVEPPRRKAEPEVFTIEPEISTVNNIQRKF